MFGNLARNRHYNEAAFARQTLRARVIYADLADHEPVPAFRKVLSDLAETSGEQFNFWALKSGIRGDEARVSSFTLWRFRMMRKILGPALTARYLLGRKEERVSNYKTYCATCTVEEDYRAIDAFVDRMHAIMEGITEKR